MGFGSRSAPPVPEVTPAPAVNVMPQDNPQMREQRAANRMTTGLRANETILTSARGVIAPPDPASRRGSLLGV
jgi:hypothetical protein